MGGEGEMSLEKVLSSTRLKKLLPEMRLKKVPSKMRPEIVLLNEEQQCRSYTISSPTIEKSANTELPP
jgi:hypothetical protein